MSDLPVYASAATKGDLAAVLREVAIPETFTMRRAELADLFERAGDRAAANLNEILSHEIPAERRRIYEALRDCPGCLIPDATLRAICGVSE